MTTDETQNKIDKLIKLILNNINDDFIVSMCIKEIRLIKIIKK